MTVDPEPTVPPADLSAREGHVSLNAERDLNIAGDVVGRDKITYVGLADAPPAPGEPPYKGLEYFDVGDADRFFGREKLVARLVGQLRQHRFLAIVGASGSGKSSLVRAGLIPALKRGQALADGLRPPKGSTGWPIHVITPGERPLRTLAGVLSHESTAVLGMADQFLEDPAAFAAQVRRRADAAGADRWLLLVDQLEELFTLCRSADERRTFVDGLMTAVEQDGPAIVVLALRADFYSHCGQFERLRAALEWRQCYIGPMSADELRRAIEEPARQSGWSLEEGLVDRLLTDTGGEPGALPLLSHALLETWKRRQVRTLTLKGYEKSGGVRGAIAYTAEALYEGLEADQRTVARSIFLQLTELGEGAPDTRRRVALNDLLSQVASREVSAVEALLQKLVEVRLVTTGEGTVEVAHEALIRQWPTLRKWLDEDRQGLRLHRQLADDAREWVDLKRDEGSLYRGARLAAALEWAEAHSNDLSALEREFLERSRENQAQQVQRLRLLYEKAEQQRKLALARQLAAQAELTRSQQPDLLPRSALLAVESMRRVPSVEADQVLRNVLALLPRPLARLEHNAEVWRASFSPDGGLLATVAGDRTVWLWDAINGRAVARLPHPDNVKAIAFSPAGKFLATACDDNVRLWPMDLLRSLVQPPDVDQPAFVPDETMRLPHADPVKAIAFSPDDGYLATACDNHTARIWEATTGREIMHKSYPYPVSVAALSHDGTYLAMASQQGGEMRVWRVLEGRQLVEVARYGAGQVRMVAFSPDGKYLATAMGESVAVWTLKGKLVKGTVENATVSTMAFSPNGQSLVVGDRTGTVRLREAATGREIARFLHGDGVTAVAFSRDGRYLGTASRDRTARVWDVDTGKEVVRAVHEKEVHALAFSPDGERLATASADETTRLWQVPAAHRPGACPYEGSDATAFSPDGQAWAIANWEERESRIRLYPAHSLGEPASGHEIARLTEAVAEMAFSLDGRYLLTLSQGRQACLVPISQPLQGKSLGHGEVPCMASILAAAFSPDGRTIATADEGGSVQLWELASGREMARASHEQVERLIFSPNGSFLATLGRDLTVRVWEAVSGNECLRLEGVKREVVFSPDGTYLAAVGGDDLARIWEIASRRQIATLEHHPVQSVAFSRDGRYLASSSWETVVWEWPAVREVTRIRHRGDMYLVAFSPDGTVLATAGWDESAWVWETVSGRRLARLPHESYLLDLAFSADGKYLATGSQDKGARIWRIERGAAEGIIGGKIAHMMVESDLESVAFSPDGRYLTTVNRYAPNMGAPMRPITRVWLWRPEDLIAETCARLTRNLTQDEWQHYLPDEDYEKTCAR